MTDFALFSDERLTIVTELAAGNGAPLATHLEAGGALDAHMRDLLIKLLRNEIELKRGNRRTWKDEMRKTSIRTALCGIQMREALLHGSYGSHKRTLERYLEADPTMKIDRLRKLAKRGLLTRPVLDSIDRVRAETAAED